MNTTIRVAIPFHLRRLAGVDDTEVMLDVASPCTQRTVLDALEHRYPTLIGTIREGDSRRPLIRFFACEQDLSHNSPDTELPEKVLNGTEPFCIVGAVAGG